MDQFIQFVQASFALLASYLVHTCLVISIGLLSAHLLRRFGPLVQSQVHRSTVAACLIILLAPVMKGREFQPKYQVSTASVDHIAFSPPKGDIRRTPSALQISPTAAPTGPAAPAERPVWTLGFSGTIGAIWLLGGGLQLLLLAGGYLQLARLKKRSRPVAERAILDLLASLADQVGVRTPALRESSLVGTPFLAGVRYPVVYLGQGFCDECDSEALKMTLIHELIHMRRQDCLWAAIRRIATVALWPNPLVWMLGNRITKSSEEAVDFLVVSFGNSKSGYANCLLGIAARESKCRHSIPAVGIAESDSEIGSRIEKILSPAERAVRTLSAQFRLGSVAATFGIAFIAVGLIAFGVNATVLASSGPALAQAEPWRAPARYLAHFKLPASQGWSMKPGQYLPDSWSTDAPSHNLTVADQRSIDAVNAIALPQTIVLYGSQRPPRAKLVKLQAFLLKYPNNFYAEYLLAHEFSLQGDRADSDRFYIQSLRDAPSILAGRYEYEDGRPLTAKDELTIEISYPREAVSARSAGADGMTPQPPALYLPVRFDENACFYVPCFRGDAYISKSSYSYVTDSPLAKVCIGESTQQENSIHLAGAQVIVAAPFIVRPKISLTGIPRSWIDAVKPGIVKSTNFAMGWKPVKHAVKYTIGLEVGSATSYGSVDDRDLPASLGPTTATHVAIDLRRSEYPFVSRMVYRLNVNAYDKTGLLLTSSDTVCFAKPGYLDHLDLTAKNLSAVLPEGVQVHSLSKGSDGSVSIVYHSVARATPQLAEIVNRRSTGFFDRGWTSFTCQAVGGHEIILDAQPAKKE